MGSIGQYSGEFDYIEDVVIENAFMINGRKSLWAHI